MDGANPGTPPGSATHQPLPQPQPTQVIVHPGVGGAIDAGGNFLQKVSGFNPQQAQTVAVIVLTLFVCGILGYMLWSGQRSQAETLAIVIRSMESESEKNRMAISVEFDRNRQSFERESKASREAVDNTGKLTLASHQALSRELGKLEAGLSELKMAITTLRMKLPPVDENICPIPRIRVKDFLTQPGIER